MLFRSDENGQVAIIVALCILPLLFFAGFMIDFSRQQGVSRDVQAALDHAAISIALHLQEDDMASDADLLAVAQTVFDGNLVGKDGFSGKALTVKRDGETATLHFEGSVQTGLAGLMGVDALSVNLMSGVQYAGQVGKTPLIPLDLALVLDTSGSMQGTRISELRVAAGELVDQVLSDVETESGVSQASNVRISVVPFNHYVNVGLNQAGQSWLTDIDDETADVTSCTYDQPPLIAQGCTFTEVCNPEREIPCQQEVSCPINVTPVKDVCTVTQIDRSWLGCVRVRPSPLDVSDVDYDTDPVGGALQREGAPCFAENAILPLTNDADLVKSVIDNLTPQGFTYIPSGVNWGQRVLSPQAPFEADDMGTVRTRGMILMSDGANTRSPNGVGSPTGKDTDEANNRLIDACDEAKAAGIQVFTVAFLVDDFETERLLRDCASTSENSFDASGERELTDAFLAIASSFAQIALTE